jgi:adenylate cyclase
MADLVFAELGIVDKYIGDAVMALWGAPEKLDDAPLRACRAAIEMQERLEELSEARQRMGQPALKVGIGINTGQAIVGLVGSPRRLEYTAIGDTVNVASRLCGLARGGQILISAATSEFVRKSLALVPLAEAQIKGRAKSVTVFELAHGEDRTVIR